MAEWSDSISHSFAVSSFHSPRKEGILISIRVLSMAGLVKWHSETALSADSPAYSCLAGLHPSLQHWFLCVTALTILSPMRNGWEVELVALAEGGVGGTFS